MVYRDTLLVFLNKFFEPFNQKIKKDSWCANGLQLSGRDEIKKIALGVSANMNFFEKAYKKGADCLIVHHSLSLIDLNQRIDDLLKNRILFLLEKKMTLIGYHFLLDHHPEIGNNAWVIKKLGAELDQNIRDEWSWTGKFKEKVETEKIIRECEKIYGTKPSFLVKGPRKINNIAVCSGAGAPHGKNITELSDRKIELYISGTAGEDTPSLCDEAKINFAAFGHYATERIGIKNLGEIIRKQFYVDIEFIEEQNNL